MAYVPNLEGEHLTRVRDNTHLTLVCGQGQWEEGCIEETQAFANVLEAKGISHYRDIWGHDVSTTGSGGNVRRRCTCQRRSVDAPDFQASGSRIWPSPHRAMSPVVRTDS